MGVVSRTLPRGTSLALGLAWPLPPWIAPGAAFFRLLAGRLAAASARGKAVGALCPRMERVPLEQDKTPVDALADHHPGRHRLCRRLLRGRRETLP